MIQGPWRNYNDISRRRKVDLYPSWQGFGLKNQIGIKMLKQNIVLLNTLILLWTKNVLLNISCIIQHYQIFKLRVQVLLNIGPQLNPTLLLLSETFK